jgi:hypothetical protein
MSQSTSHVSAESLAADAMRQDDGPYLHTTHADRHNTYLERRNSWPCIGNEGKQGVHADMLPCTFSAANIAKCPAEACNPNNGTASFPIVSMGMGTAPFPTVSMGMGLASATPAPAPVHGMPIQFNVHAPLSLPMFTHEELNVNLFSVDDDITTCFEPPCNTYELYKDESGFSGTQLSMEYLFKADAEENDQVCDKNREKNLTVGALALSPGSAVAGSLGSQTQTSKLLPKKIIAPYVHRKKNAEYFFDMNSFRESTLRGVRYPVKICKVKINHGKLVYYLCDFFGRKYKSSGDKIFQTTRVAEHQYHTTTTKTNTWEKASKHLRVPLRELLVMNSDLVMLANSGTSSETPIFICVE